jgi:hypothetical protein
VPAPGNDGVDLTLEDGDEADQRRFFAFLQILLDYFGPRALSKFFIRLHDLCYPNDPWQDQPATISHRLNGKVLACHPSGLLLVFGLKRVSKPLNGELALKKKKAGTFEVACGDEFLQELRDWRQQAADERKVGDEVKAQKKGKGDFKTGEIMATNPDGTYAVRFGEGTGTSVEDRVAEKSIECQCLTLDGVECRFID